jgi:hypothetical protein
VSPYGKSLDGWSSGWVNLHSGKPVLLVVAPEPTYLDTDAIRVQDYRDVLYRHLTHPEAKAAGADGEPCGPHTRGELRRLHIHLVELPWHIGRESNELEEVQAWLTSPNRTYVTYADEQSEWKRVRRILKTIPRRQLAKLSGLHVRTVKDIVNTARLPHWNHRKLLWEIAENHRQKRIRTADRNVCQCSS